MRILICGIMPKQAYSGGRYHAWMMAEAFAAAGHEVVFWTNNEPIFLDDFSTFEAHQKITLKITSDFSESPGNDWDFIWLIPHKNPPHHVFRRALEISHASKAKLGFLNFETPNWVAKTSPINDEAWRAWRIIAPHTHLILASTNEGLIHAKEYFGDITSARYASCNPPINNFVADSIVKPTTGNARKSIICITRFGNSHGHKGGREILDHAGKELTDCELTFIVGTKNVPYEDRRDYQEWGEQYDVHVKFQHRATDAEKFNLLKNADLMIFLSRFEGFGYPPVEALYSGLPCIVYDLPVLREVSGDTLSYVPLDRPEELNQRIKEVMNNLDDHKKRVSDLEVTRFSFDTYKEKMSAIMTAEQKTQYSSNTDDINSAIDKLKKLDALHQSQNRGSKTTATDARSAKAKLSSSLVSILAALLAAIPPLRRAFTHALFHKGNLNRLMEDKHLSSLLFTDVKPLSKRIRQNQKFLKHLMLSKDGIDLVPEVIAHENAHLAIEELAKNPEIVQAVTRNLGAAGNSNHLSGETLSGQQEADSMQAKKNDD